MEALLPFFIILFSGLFLSEFFQRVHLPWVIALMVSGFIIGPAGFGIIEANPVLSFLAELGLIFVMFMAGIETDFFKKSREGLVGKAFIIGLFSSVCLWLFGYNVALYLDMSIFASILLGIIFISSSVAVAVPILEESGVIKGQLGKLILITMIIQDIISLIAFAVFSRVTNPEEVLSSFLVYPLLILIFFLLQKGIPYVRKYFIKEFHTEDKDIFEQELRAVLVLLVGIVALFALLGVHEILAAFLAGMILSDMISHKDIHKNIHAIGYGLFIPIFFASIGMTTDLSGISLTSGAFLGGLVAIVFGVIFLKVFVTYISSRFMRVKPTESLVIGISMIPQLSTTLALGYAGRQMGIFGNDMVASLVVLSIVSVIVCPILLRIFIKKINPPQA